jgi:hypothetical protein
MISRILLLFLLTGLFVLKADGLKHGMSMEEVRIELGHPESTMEVGSKQIQIYQDGTRLEFQNGELIGRNGTPLSIQQKTSIKPAPTPEPTVAPTPEPRIEEGSLLDTEVIQPEKDLTITASFQLEEQDLSKIGENYESNHAAALKRMEKELQSEAALMDREQSSTLADRLVMIGISFGIEVVVTWIVLSIAFSLSGFPSVIRQLVLLSLAVAVVGALLDFVLQAGLLNPVRSGAGFLVLLILIRQVTDVREWATAIKIAILARIISIALMWGIMVGLFTLFSL